MGFAPAFGYAFMLFYIIIVECTEYYRCHHKLSPMNNNHILDRKMMVNVSNQIILCGLSMMTPWRQSYHGVSPWDIIDGPHSMLFGTDIK